MGAWLLRVGSSLPSLSFTAPVEFAHRLVRVCLDYIESAQLPDGRFHNFRTQEGSWADEVGSEDSFGRTIWSLRTYLRLCPQGEQAERVRACLAKAEPQLPRLGALRAIAFVLLEEEDPPRLRLLGRRLVESYRLHRQPDWRWFEPMLTYENARLPHALLLAAARLANPEWLEIGREALDFLLEQSFSEAGYLLPIGNEGWYPYGATRATFDQQPVEAGSTAELCLNAWRLFEYDRFLEDARRALEWYHGNNLLKQSLYDPSTGIVYDGLTPTGVNLNRGAESVLSYLMARLKWEIYTGGVAL